MRNEIIGEIASGWCSPENSHKEMDTTLAEAIADEVMKVIDAKFTSHNKDCAVPHPSDATPKSCATCNSKGMDAYECYCCKQNNMCYYEAQDFAQS